MNPKMVTTDDVDEMRRKILVVSTPRYHRVEGVLEGSDYDAADPPHFYACGPVRGTLLEAMNDANTLAKALAMIERGILW